MQMFRSREQNPALKKNGANEHHVKCIIEAIRACQSKWSCLHLIFIDYKLVSLEWSNTMLVGSNR